MHSIASQGMPNKALPYSNAVTPNMLYLFTEDQAGYYGDFEDNLVIDNYGLIAQKLFCFSRLDNALTKLNSIR
ncbi:hypothetical protein BCU00_010135 [Vibrio breoganii]|uniref:hypothetical protein n=1 Tax=Vibrio breoganii TaxID=553239 RepID=UPI0010565A58|nr:hypothetical protein [Vibrio breoganii]